MLNSLQNITIGNYFPSDSIIHRMDSRIKFFLIIFLIISATIIPPYYPIFFIGFFSIVLGMLSRVPFKVLIKGLKPFLFLFLFTFLFHLFLTPGRPIHFFFLGNLGATQEGFHQGIIIDFRLIVLIYLSCILTLTTSPQKMVNAIEWYLWPLRLFGFPVRNFSMMILISLKFIPILFQETAKVASLPHGKSSKDMKWNFRQRIKETISLVTPVVINSFHRADELAKEIDIHGFDVIEKL
ncbi:MAG: energy-coupling factor transporter transmembrane protein EcfT [Nitrospinota bacterium]|nr:energy-coupling factor transporter transmembrane protein EcfT [Nitrospinota bacterium]MDP7581259.1 energy-coupling factor transporter transmembrane protein EcfT [Nitrospinota bacterium]HJN03184.1 energy-coupling factor transporter transmembrane protein EcfT [Nitrospinota bacterium]